MLPFLSTTFEKNILLDMIRQCDIVRHKCWWDQFVDLERLDIGDRSRMQCKSRTGVATAEESEYTLT